MHRAVCQAEIDAADEGYRNLVKFTADMNGKIGDMLYAAGLRERAVKHYEEAVEEAPDRRDILEKVGNYHSEIAEENLKKGLLEEAMAGRSVLSRGGVGGSSTFFNAANGLFHGTGSPSVGIRFLFMSSGSRTCRSSLVRRKAPMAYSS